MKTSILFLFALALVSGLVKHAEAGGYDGASNGASCSSDALTAVRVHPGNNTISNALAKLPSDGKTYTLLLAAGSYTEQVNVTRSNVVFRSCAKKTGEVIVQFNASVSTSGNNNDASTAVLTVWASNFTAYGIAFRNIYPQQKNTAALALTVSPNATHAAFYDCTFFGFQDTMLINKYSEAYFKRCRIEGSVDFIWGYGTAFFDNCTIASNSHGYLTAHNRHGPDYPGAFVFSHCQIIPVLTSIPGLANASIAYTSIEQAEQNKTTYLGRPYSQYARVVYMFSHLGAHINPAGWSVWQTLTPQTGTPGNITVLFGEYMNSGPGAVGPRANFSTALTSETVRPFTLNATFGGDLSWINISA